MSPTEAEVRSLVRQILTRLQDGEHQSSASRLIDADTINKLPAGSSLDIPTNAIITPLARDAAWERRIRLIPAGTALAAQLSGIGSRSIAIAADHGGFSLKEELKPFLSELGYEVVDLGTNSKESVDYPDYAYAAASLVSQNKCLAAIIVDGAGIGSCITANKVPGVRASMCYDLSTAKNAREHNHANVLTLGAGLVGTNIAKQIVKTWLETPWGAGRHARRVEKIMAIERRFSK